ncbi:MAG: outer membrane protein assembly factor BamD [Gammaproteobacteria bacterium]|nr:outer membrane protein assembly factor BamD [Gammaproteobacteria bacterium]
MAIQRLVIAIFTAALIFSGCSSMNPRDQRQSWSADRYREEAHAAMQLNNYGTAADYLQELTVRYPLDSHTRESYLQIAYAHYKNLRYDATIAAADKYLTLYPDDKDDAYAYYLRGLADFERGINALNDPVKLDDPNIANQARAAYDSFLALIQHYPDSNYARDAHARLNLLRDRLANHELQLAQQALEKGNKDSARTRARYVAEHYADTQVATEAMKLLVQLNHAPATPTATPATPEPVTATKPAIAVAEPIDEEASPARESMTAELPTGAEPVVAQPQPAPFASTGEPSPSAEDPKQTELYLKGLRDEAWLLRQRGDFYTLQIAGTSQARWVRNFVNQHDIGQDVAYYRKHQAKGEWYSVLYGLYANLADARAARRDILNQLGTQDAWIRPLRDVQKDIKSR